MKTINSVRTNNLSLTYQRFSPLGCKDTGRRNFEFVAKTQFLLTQKIENIGEKRNKNDPKKFYLKF